MRQKKPLFRQNRTKRGEGRSATGMYLAPCQTSSIYTEHGENLPLSVIAHLHMTPPRPHDIEKRPRKTCGNAPRPPCSGLAQTGRACYGSQKHHATMVSPTFQVNFIGAKICQAIYTPELVVRGQVDTEAAYCFSRVTLVDTLHMKSTETRPYRGPPYTTNMHTQPKPLTLMGVRLKKTKIAC